MGIIFAKYDDYQVTAWSVNYAPFNQMLDQFKFKRSQTIILGSCVMLYELHWKMLDIPQFYYHTSLCPVGDHPAYCNLEFLSSMSFGNSMYGLKIHTVHLMQKYNSKILFINFRVYNK